MIAIIPAAGLGTRMASVTNGGSKEALALGNRTVLDLVIDEAFAAGAERAVVVSSRGKGDVEEIVAARPECVDLRIQTELRGLAHAISITNESADESLILLGDTVFEAPGPSRPLAQAGAEFDACLHVQPVLDEQVSKYGIVECEGDRVIKVLEKPALSETASRLAVSARYRLSDRILRLVGQSVADTPPGVEADLTSVINRAILLGMKIGFVTTNGKRYDCGSPAGYAEAVARFGS